MKSNLRIALLCAAGLALSCLPALAADAVTPRLTVTGSGESTAAPDLALLSLSVVREAPSAGEALSADNKAMAKVLDAMKQAGIADRDLQTSGLSIEPRRVFPDDKDPGKAPQIVGYTVTNTLSIRVKDIAAVGKLLDTAVALGVNSGGDIEFTNQHPEVLLDQARRNAVKDALRKAQIMTEAAGVELGRILDMSEADAPARPIPLMREKFAAAAAVPVAAGENSYRVEVTVTFEIGK